MCTGTDFPGSRSETIAISFEILLIRRVCVSL